MVFAQFRGVRKAVSAFKRLLLRRRVRQEKERREAAIQARAEAEARAAAAAAAQSAETGPVAGDMTPGVGLKTLSFHAGASMKRTRSMHTIAAIKVRRSGECGSGRAVTCCAYGPVDRRDKPTSGTHHGLAARARDD